MNVLNKNDINFLLIRQTLKIKDIEISLCYTSFISFTTQSKIYINWIFYYFMISRTNNHNITFFIIRKWKLILRFIIESKSFSFSINKKSNRSNFTTSNFSHKFFTYSFFTSISKFTLIFNKKFVDSKIMCQSTKIEIEKFKNRNVAFNKFFRQCRHCKQFFIFEIFFYKHVSHCNESIKEFKHVCMIKKLNDSWKKRSNWRYFIDFSCFFVNISLIAQIK